jgi:FlaA1/EpsC-like NDP-sugar epimerase
MGDNQSSPEMTRREGTRKRVYRLVQAGLDVLTLAAALGFAYLLRFDFDIPARNLTILRTQLPVVIGIQFVCMYLAGVYRLMWRYVGLQDVPRFLRAAGYSTVSLVVLRLLPFAALRDFRVPISVIVLDVMLAFGGVLALRVVRRSAFEERKRRLTATDPSVPIRRPVILVGAGRAGVLSAREIKSRADLAVFPVGFVDDDPLKQSSVIAGTPVLGTSRDLPALVRRFNVDHVIITIAEADPSSIRRIIEICERIPIKVRTIPGYYDLLQGRVSIRRIRDVDPDALLGREAVELEKGRLDDFLSDKAVLVTGAGGSIGSELALQVARFRPRSLVLVERSEFALFEVHRKLVDLWPDVNVVPKMADCTDTGRMGQILGEHRPEVLLHVAAHKHVPMMESNPGEAVKNNSIGTHKLGELAAEWKVGTFVLISTDKAVRPRSIMGASKRIAEMVVQDLDRRYDTCFTAVRFGNVLGSAGSVIPIFNEQISRGGPVTVTDERMRRYFMSISEAAQLVLTAATYSEGGEIFILDMGEPVPIVQLAEKLIRLSGFEPYEEIDIIFTGARPGEKIYEELGTEEEQLTPTANAKIFVATSAQAPPGVDQVLQTLQELVEVGASAERIRDALDAVIPDSQMAIGMDSLP